MASSGCEGGRVRGVAASALKHTMAGDFLAATRAEIEAAIDAREGGALQR